MSSPFVLLHDLTRSHISNNTQISAFHEKNQISALHVALSVHCNPADELQFLWLTHKTMTEEWIFIKKKKEIKTIAYTVRLNNGWMDG